MKILTSKLAIIPLIILLLIGYFVFFVRDIPYDVTTATALTVSIRNNQGLAISNRSVSDADLDAIKHLLGQGTGVLNDSTCLCVGVDLIFDTAEGEMVFHPAGDDTDAVRFVYNGGDYYFHIGAENKAQLQEILERYGAVWPFGV